MATLQGSALKKDPTPATVARKARPVLWWAWVGAAATVFVVALWVRWLTSDQSRTITPGPTPMPTFMKVNIHAQEVVGLTVLVGVLYWFVYRPIRREGRMSWDGMFFLCALGLVWQDQLQNIFGYHVLVNAEFVNWGSWYNFIPGWMPNDRMTLVEPVLWITIWYGYATLFGAIATNWVMRKARQRWPAIGNAGLVSLCFGLLVVVLAPMEVAYMALGMYCYPSAIPAMTIFSGHYYQYPLYECFLYAAFWSAMCCLRYYRNDRGESIAERASAGVDLSARKRNAVRFLAIWGIMNVAYVLIYNLPVAMIGGLHPHTFPDDIQKRSYFVGQVCGEGTGYACPGGVAPLQHGNSAYLDENGKLVVPDGATLPKVVPFER